MGDPSGGTTEAGRIVLKLRLETAQHTPYRFGGQRRLADLCAQWLPYYDEALRLERLQMVRDACLLNIERVHFAVRRELYFYAFDRLYHAFQEFLQAVFIANRVYPIAYNKWIREQVEGGWDYLHYMPSYIPC